MVEFRTPTGRLVQGNLWVPSTTDMEGRPLQTKDGKPRVQWFCGLAVLKTNPDVAAFLALIHDSARQMRPTAVDRPGFAFKYKDGDDPQYKDKVGFPGHYIFSLTSGFDFKIHNAALTGIITDPKDCKRGDYLQVIGAITHNTSESKPGIFLNIRGVWHVGYGEEILGKDYRSEFGNAGTPVLPPGASATPVASGPPPQIPAENHVTPPPQVPSAPPQVPAAPPIAPPPPPAQGFTNPTGPPTTAKANGASYEQLIALGWTHDQLTAHGMI